MTTINKIDPPVLVQLLQWQNLIYIMVMLAPSRSALWNPIRLLQDMREDLVSQNLLDQGKITMKLTALCH
ncbi:hypothetical protein [Trichormus variabilis]|uniref:hypothetical protein n=1 Tax=Anabaena variabilis TaxID=264691 RepID=UPI000F8DF068|nr:hypothetical protein [Trichormus variabilis]MBD2628132.1 hypothetical protein [Trichormus variabilis FACHB-164]